MPNQSTYPDYKILWAIVRPGNLLVILLTVGVGLHLSASDAAAGAGTAMICISLLSMLCILFLPIGAWLIAPLEKRHPFPVQLPHDISGIVVLGGAVEPGPARVHGVISMNAAAERMMAVPLLMHRFPDAKIVLTGGDAQHKTEQSATIAEASHRYFAELGLEGANFHYEFASRNTRESAVLTRSLAPSSREENWLLVTSAWHMPRALASFRATGWRIEPYPVDYRSLSASGAMADVSFSVELSVVDSAAHEWIGLLFYRLLGWI